MRAVRSARQNFKAKAHARAHVKIFKAKAHCGGVCVKFKTDRPVARNFRIDPFAKPCVIDLFAKAVPIDFFAAPHAEILEQI